MLRDLSRRLRNGLRYSNALFNGSLSRIDAGESQGEDTLK